MFPRRRSNDTFTQTTKPTPASYGVGAIWIDGVQYWSDGVSFVPTVNITGSNTLVIVGDSFDVRSKEFQSGVNTVIDAYGIWNITNMLLGQRFNILNIDAINGTGALAGTTPYASRMQAGAYTFKPRFIGLRASVNDFVASNTYAALVAEYTRLFKEINANGSTVITNTVNPTNFYTTTLQRSTWQKFNMWLLNTAPTLFDIIVLPQHYQTSDHSILTVGVDAALSDDQTHPNLPGAFIVAQTSANILANYLDAKGIGESPAIAQMSIGVDDETVIDPNPINIGITGAKAGNVTGSVAASFGIRTSGGLGSVVASKIARTDGPGEWQQCVWTPSAANQSLEFYATGAARPLNTGFAVGNIIQLVCEIEMDAATLNADAHYPVMKITWSGVSGNVIAYAFNSVHPALGKSGWSGIVATPKIAIPAGANGLYITLGFMSKTTGPMTIRFGQHSFINHSTTLAV